MKKLLLIVDMQYDFLNGSLTVDGAQAIGDNLASHIEELGEGHYDNIVFTADWHPINHCSFETWPKHCVQFTKGASIYEPLVKAAYDNCSNVAIMTKGNVVNKEEYSIMDNKLSSDLLMKMIEDERIDTIEVVGVAGDFCVMQSVEGLIANGLKEKVVLNLNYIASIDGGEKINNFVKSGGVAITMDSMEKVN